MSSSIACYRCGASLEALTLPLSRQDECPQCRNYLHVCKMCRNFSPTAIKQCTEDDAEEVLEKERLNFCDWFIASDAAFDPARKASADQARAALDALFDGGDDSSTADAAQQDAENLFKS
ncbi:MAG: hypothetical protein KJO82_00305 [Gammaproteobacteria bacterium]|nr:hypothetical protein [Gammaproteobacteria bacterium]